MGKIKGIDLTRMECKVVSGFESVMVASGIDLTRMECKGTEYSSDISSDKGYRFNQNGM